MAPRCVIFIVDMLAGHWVEGSVLATTNLPPPNVSGYVRANKLPSFGVCIENGVFVKGWNKGICNTPYGQKYLASGSYDVEAVVTGNQPYWSMTRGIEKPTIVQLCKRKYPQGKVASFGSDAWMQTGWWKAADCTMGWGSYFSDLLTEQHAIKWMMDNPDWKMVVLYLAQYDKTGSCPVFREKASYMEDKHHSLLQVDRYLWLLNSFLKETGWWEETYLFLASDHGCHVGCNVAVEAGRKNGVSEADLPNYCSDHQAPYDCYLWDFEANSPSGTRCDCCRRITFVVSGGALSPHLRGTIVDYAEIIDFAPTVADLMGIEFAADGKSVIR